MPLSNFNYTDIARSYFCPGPIIINKSPMTFQNIVRLCISNVLVISYTAAGLQANFCIQTTMTV